MTRLVRENAAGPVAGYGAIDEAGINPLEVLEAQPKLGHNPGAKTLQDDIGLGGELFEY